jgi:hypothetical protein
MYLLRYRREAEWRVVVIADAYSVAHARMVAAGLEPGTFVNGHAVSRASVEGLPAHAVGRLLTLADLVAMVDGTKKPPARSVWRPRGGGGQPRRNKQPPPLRANLILHVDDGGVGWGWTRAWDGFLRGPDRAAAAAGRPCHSVCTPDTRRGQRGAFPRCA